jgi:ferredoxin
MRPRTRTMAQAQRAYDNLTPEDVYGPEPEEEDTVVIITDDCVGCGSCLTGIDMKKPVCPKGAISVCNGKADIDQKKCTQCGRCISFCGVGAIVEDKV